jgi:tetratricopeptide (TPR) repeat protein
MTEAGSHPTALELVRSATADGERALAGHDPRAAEDAFTAALGHLDELDRADEATHDLAAAAHIGLGRVHLADNDIRAADLRFDRVQRLRPASPDGFYWGGCAAAHAADHRRAEWLLTAALDRDPQHGKAYLQRAYVRLRQGRAELSLPDLLAAADRHVVDDNARLLTAALLVHHGKAAQAAAIAADVSPSADSAAILGMALWRQGKFDAAATELDRAVASGCHDDAVLLHHGLALLRRNDFDASSAVWQRLRDSHPHDLADLIEETNLRDAVPAVARGDWGLARTRLRAGGPRGLRYLAVLEFRDGRHAPAEQYWQQTLSTTTDPVSRFGLAMSAIRDAEPADAELRDLCADPETPDRIRRLAGRVLAALQIRSGDWSAAVETLESAGGADWPAVLAEARYRAGGQDAWLNLADADRADVPGSRAGRERTLLRCANGVAAARRGDWSTAADALPDHLDGDLALLKAVAYVLSDRRANAAAHLARAAVRAPADHRISHAQTMLHLHALSATPDRLPDLLDWPGCIGASVSVLYDEDFWIRWRARAGRRYRCIVPEDAIHTARSALEELIERRLPSDDLGLLLRRERAAAALLARLGGLPDADPAGPALVCGPLRIAELGLERRLGEFLLSRPATEDDMVQFFRQFSEIGLAVATLAVGRPRAAALTALDLRCPSCARTGGRTHPAMISEPLLCEPECPEFDRRNPAFSLCPDKHDELARASAELAARTLLDIARGDTTKPVMDLADARRCWRGAITLAMRFNHRDAILHEVADEALGRALVLAKRNDHAEAIAVLDAVSAVIPAKDRTERDRVESELAFLLNARGVALFDESPANGEQALAALRRAVELRPDRPLPRFNLGTLLSLLSARAFHRFDVEASVRLLTEAVDQFGEGAAMHGTENFHHALDRARRKLGEVLKEYEDRQRDAES